MKITPMLQQYLEIKNQYPDTILFYRMGDFYEMFFDDAVEAAKILNITLTSRSSKDDENRIPMCGVPYHSAASYLGRLIKAGRRVAICEQVEDPKEAKGLVRREVVRVVTPGLVTEDQLLEEKENRFIAALGRNGKEWGLSLLDLSTGEFLVSETETAAELLDDLARLDPAELLLPDHEQTALGSPPRPGASEPGVGAADPWAETIAAVRQLRPHLCLTRRPGRDFKPDHAREALLAHFRTANLAGFGCEGMTAGTSAAGALLLYLQETQKSSLEHIESLRPLGRQGLLLIDESSRRNLELTRTIIGNQREGSLLAALDRTATPMGARLLKKQLLFPLQEVGEINRRLDAVEQLIGQPEPAAGLGRELAAIQDLERLNSRAVLGHANGRDLIALKLSLARLPAIRHLLAEQKGLLAELGESIDELAELHALLAAAIRDEPPVGLREGNLIRDGYHPELDELIAIQRDGKGLIAGLEARERERTGIANLKVGYNKIFGYFLEVSRGRLAEVPDNFIRKQTLVNAERFITPELKEFEEKVSGAEEKRLELEYRLFVEIRSQVAAASPRLLRTAEALARLDVLAGLAEVAASRRYVRPVVNQGERIVIREGRHPVIERHLPAGRFVPNDITLDQEQEEVLIITGPNMAGKSTVLRQTALIVLMAQMGGFVPAAQAEIGVVDRIFTRVGAMDDLSRGQSTFMVEMNETANILNNATEKSLVILDEIGRGTSTFDGLAIAWAVAEELVNKNGKGIKTLFATHYHELTELAALHPRIKNYHIAVREWNDSIIFLHKLLAGGTNRSYGIQVAALAGVPRPVVARARELLHNIEAGEFNRQGKPRIAAQTPPTGERQRPSQLRLFGPADPLRQRLQEIRPEAITPLEALNLLAELHRMSEKD